MLGRKELLRSLYSDARSQVPTSGPAVEVWNTRSTNLLHVCLTEGANAWQPSDMPKEFVTNNDKAFIIRVRKMCMLLAAARRRRQRWPLPMPLVAFRGCCLSAGAASRRACSKLCNPDVHQQ